MGFASAFGAWRPNGLLMQIKRRARKAPEIDERQQLPRPAGETRCMSNQRPIIDDVLAHLALFRGMAPAQARAIAATCWTMVVPRGESLVRTGAHPPGVFAVAYGSVKLTLRNGGAEERVLKLVAARQSFGEASALLGRSSPYDAVALAETEAIVIPGPPLRALLEREAPFATALVASLAERHLQLCAEIGAAALHSAKQRLAAYLESLPTHAAPGGARTVELPVSKTVVAARLGMKKETLSRLLHQLVGEGIVEVRRREIAILDRTRLSAAASG
jgi:CRP-like cAMP-binding protein